MSSEKVYPGRPQHGVPLWVAPGAAYHIRLRTSAKTPFSLTAPAIAPVLLESARAYERLQHWQVLLFLLMPDHIHALLRFGEIRSMGGIIGGWKKYHSRQQGIPWQPNYFDHRIRNDRELLEKASYIRRNPVAVGLCRTEEDWPWWIEEGRSGTGARREME